MCRYVSQNSVTVSLVRKSTVPGIQIEYEDIK